MNFPYIPLIFPLVESVNRGMSGKYTEDIS